MKLTKIRRFNLEIVIFVYCLYLSVKNSFIIFASDDDVAASTASFMNQNILDNAIGMAQNTGRFYQIVYVTLWQSPYYITQDVQGIAVFRSFYFLITNLFLLLSFRLLFGKRIASMFFLLYITFVSLAGNYNPLTSYLMWFLLSYVFLMYSGLLFKNYLISNKSDKSNLLLSLVLLTFFFLAYETHILVFPYFLAIYYFYKSQSREAGRRMTLFSSCYGAIVLIYLISYFLFRHFYSANYSGSDASLRLTKPGIDNFFGYITAHFTKAQTPIYNFCFDCQPLNVELGFGIVLFATMSLVVMKSTLIIYRNSKDSFRTRAIERKAFRSGEYANRKLAILFLLIAVSTINLPILFSVKYQQTLTVEPYVASFLPFIFLLLLFVIAVDTLEQLVDPRRKLFPVAVFLCLIIISLIGVRNFSLNEAVLDGKATRTKIWHLTSTLLSQVDISKEGKIASYSLTTKSGTGPYSYWEYALQYFSGKSVIFTRTESEFLSSSSEDYRLEIVETPRGYVALLYSPKLDRIFLVAENTNNLTLETKTIATVRKVPIELKRDQLVRIDVPNEFESLVVITN
jgi:hypothetical protein